MKKRALLQVNIINECRGYPAPRALLERVFLAAWETRPAKMRALKTAAVTILLTTDAAMRDLNLTHKGRAEATDVLAFSDGDEDPETRIFLLGDIALSVDTARREAAQRNLRGRDEVALYALHGLLHLCGMRDDSPAGQRAMMQAQAKIFAAVGLTYDTTLTGRELSH